MLSFLGPAQAAALAPFCNARDVAAWAGAHTALHVALTADGVWRELLAAHYRPALACAGQQEDAERPAGAEEETPEALIKQMPEGLPRQVYVALLGTNSQPFVLAKRARLNLELHELKEWDKHRSLFLLSRQASQVAKALGRKEAVEKLHDDMAPVALELVSIQAMMGGGVTPRLLEDSGLQWGPTADADLRRLMERRLQKRRAWWQKQREFLLEDLGWN